MSVDQPDGGVGVDDVAPDVREVKETKAKEAVKKFQKMEKKHTKRSSRRAKYVELGERWVGVWFFGGVSGCGGPP
eukprot:911524-Amphidinium_carterae.1